MTTLSGSMLEQVVYAAVDARMIDAASRERLLQDLPPGFRYSLPTVSRPIDQLRYDLMELSRTPRLIGLSEPPIVYWLRQARVIALERRSSVAKAFEDALRTLGKSTAETSERYRAHPVSDGPDAKVPTGGAASGDSANPRWVYDYYMAYAHDAAADATAIVDALTAEGLAVFSPRDLLPGDLWDEALPEALRASRSIILIISDATERSFYQREDIIQAVDRSRQTGRRVIPVTLNGPGALTDGSAPYGLSRLVRLDVPSLGGLTAAAKRLAEIARADQQRESEGTATAPIGMAPSTQTAARPLVAGELQVGDIVAGRFALDSLVGRGPATNIWLAKDRAGGPPVAVKFLHDEIAADPSRRAAFFAAIDVRLSLDLAGLVHVRMPGREEAGHFYYVEPFVVGGDLEERAKSGDFGPDQAMAAIISVGRTLSQLHQRGLHHGALNPGDVLFDASGRPMLVDVGLGEANPRILESRAIFIAPEALDGKGGDAHSDQYSLGMCAYFALHGGALPPWAGRAPGRLSEDLPISPHSATALRRAVAFDPADRFESMDSMVAALAVEDGMAEAPTTAHRRRGRPAINPFTPGPALDGTASPPGRTKEVNRVLGQLNGGGSVLLLGPRRSGKTSILRYLLHRLAADGVPGRLIALESCASSTADELADALEPGADRRTLVRALEAARVAGTPRTTYLIDEVGYLRGADLGSRPTVFGWLRALGQSTAAFVYAGSREDWREVRRHARKEPGSSFGNDVLVVPVGPMGDDEAQGFLMETAPDDVRIEAEMAQKVIRRVGGWPFYLQVMGQGIVEAVREGQGPPLGDVGGWVAALYRQRVLEDNDAVLRDGWTALPTTVRHTLLRPWGERLALEVVRDHASEAGVMFRALPREVRDALYEAELYDGISGWWLRHDRPLLDWAGAHRDRLSRELEET